MYVDLAQIITVLLNLEIAWPSAFRDMMDGMRGDSVLPQEWLWSPRDVA